MSTNYVSLTCPDCNYSCVYNCRGRCRCGSYLIAFWEGMNTWHRQLILPAGKVWGLLPDNKWQLLKESEFPEDRGNNEPDYSLPGYD